MIEIANNICTTDLSRIPTKNGAESRSGWTKIQQMCENVRKPCSATIV